MKKRKSPQPKRGKLTTALTLPILNNKSNEYRPSVVELLLGPLRNGKPVLLKVSDSTLRKRDRQYEPILAICPMDVMGMQAKALLVSFPPYGSEIIDITQPVKMIQLYRVGMGMKTSRALAEALNYIYGDHHHGRQKPE